jgi:hypothetical protein
MESGAVIIWALQHPDWAKPNKGEAGTTSPRRQIHACCPLEHLRSHRRGFPWLLNLVPARADPKGGHTEGRGLTARGALIEIDPCVAVTPMIRYAL